MTVEPLDGSELDRLITVLLNATGVVYRAIEATEDPDGSGEQIVGAVAKRMSGALAPFVEHYTDDELAELTGALAHITLLFADDLGLEAPFEPGAAESGAPEA